MIRKNWLVGKRSLWVKRYAKFVTEHLAKAANRIDHYSVDNVVDLSRFSHAHQTKRV
jgi:hypothetical protein